MNRHVLVTGASSGIGRAIARQLLKQGHHVIGVCRDIGKFKLKHEHFSALAIDLSQLADLPEKLRLLQKQYPAIDAVVFCAGSGRFASLEEFSYTQIQAIINLNLTSQMMLTRAMLPALKKRPMADLVFIGSEAALSGSRKGSIYCASKFGLRGFTQALREECSKANVRVSLINPGMVKTAFFKSLNFAPGDAASNYILPEEVAEAVNYILRARVGITIDEINLNPANQVIKFKE